MDINSFVHSAARDLVVAKGKESLSSTTRGSSWDSFKSNEPKPKPKRTEGNEGDHILTRPWASSRDMKQNVYIQF